MRLVAALVLAVASYPAVAGSIPRIDVDAACRKSGAYKLHEESTLAVQYLRCMSTNQSDYNKIKSAWGKLSVEEQDRCVREFNPETETIYLRLTVCVLAAVAENARIKAEAASREAERSSIEAGRTIPKLEFRY